MKIAAIDPGLQGAIAFYDTRTGDLQVYDMPVADENIDPATLSAFFKDMKPDAAMLERVGARPGQGVSSMFKFGCGFGMVQGVIAALNVRLHLVTPAKWKKHFRLDSEKESARARALQLWPERSDLFKRKKDHGRAEAALIALYFAETGKFAQT